MGNLRALLAAACLVLSRAESSFGASLDTSYQAESAIVATVSDTQVSA